MNDTKAWYLSKGVWGGIIAAGAGVASLFGFTLGEGEVQSLTDITVAFVTAVAGAWAVFGRVVATSKIG